MPAYPCSSKKRTGDSYLKEIDGRTRCIMKYLSKNPGIPSVVVRALFSHVKVTKVKTIIQQVLKQHIVIQVASLTLSLLLDECGPIVYRPFVDGKTRRCIELSIDASSPILAISHSDIQVLHQQQLTWSKFESQCGRSLGDDRRGASQTREHVLGAGEAAAVGAGNLFCQWPCQSAILKLLLVGFAYMDGSF